jgi:hypothetical protein
MSSTKYMDVGTLQKSEFWVRDVVYKWHKSTMYCLIHSLMAFSAIILFLNYFPHNTFSNSKTIVLQNILWLFDFILIKRIFFYNANGRNHCHCHEIVMEFFTD